MFADLTCIPIFPTAPIRRRNWSRKRERHGLAAIALTDHDTVEGCAHRAGLPASVDIEFIPGTELTAEQEGDEIHILGLLHRY